MAIVNDIVKKVWGLCDILRDDGVAYYQYVNELTYLLFLKMAQETKTESKLLQGCRWTDLTRFEDANTQHKTYLDILHRLGTEGNEQVQQIFANPTTFLHHPENLKKLVTEIDSIDWHCVSREGLGDIYEGLLEKNASEKKSGAGQYFTARPLIQSIINVMKPQADETIVDPAAGTCGFLILAQEYITKTNGSANRENTKFFGVELVRDTHRLALMNALLHQIPGEIINGDTLAEDGINLPNADLILTNPPFGTKKGSDRKMRTLPFPTTNKELAFLQLIYKSLKPEGRCAVVVPDGVLSSEGVGAKVRADLMEKCNLHTILRLPTGIFYAHGVKTNVLFFTRGTRDTGNTTHTWIYDLRTNMPVFGKRTPLTHEHFIEFEKCYGTKADGTSKRFEQTQDESGAESRFRKFSRTEFKERRDSLDISWLKDNSSGETDLPEPEDIVLIIQERLGEALSEIETLSALLDRETPNE